MNDGSEEYDGVPSFGAGKAWQFHPRAIGYVMMDIAGHTTEDYARLRPHVGARLDFGKTKAWMYTGIESSIYEPDLKQVWGGKVQRTLSDTWSLDFEAADERATRFTFGATGIFDRVLRRRCSSE
jgi:hypothetical protein